MQKKNSLNKENGPGTRFKERFNGANSFREASEKTGKLGYGEPTLIFTYLIPMLNEVVQRIDKIEQKLIVTVPTLEQVRPYDKK